MDYLLIKWLHILSASILFGTGIGSAFYMFVANRTGNVCNIYFACRFVVIADWLFTTPAGFVQFISGYYLMYLLEFSFGEYWLFSALMLFIFAGVCWLPVVWLQIKMRDLAQIAYMQDKALPMAYWRMEKYWIILGSLAFPAMVGIFYLMVFKP